MSGRDYYTHYPRTILWLVPGGEVEIGGDEADASPTFRVEVAPFYISKFPITNEQYEAYDPGFERAPTSRRDRDPAVGVSWEEADGYCRWYAEVSRKPMRLPTEIEWEHACRGGVSGQWFFEDPDEADLYLWDGAPADQVPRLDEKKANGFGLYGMLGGVWEWTASSYRPYPLAENGDTPDGEERRILRGGSFRTEREELSCSRRRPESSEARFDDAGFRIVKSLRR